MLALRAQAAAEARVAVAVVVPIAAQVVFLVHLVAEAQPRDKRASRGAAEPQEQTVSTVLREPSLFPDILFPGLREQRALRVHPAVAVAVEEAEAEDRKTEMMIGVEAVEVEEQEAVAAQEEQEAREEEVHLLYSFLIMEQVEVLRIASLPRERAEQEV
jgi:hypothetical protein